MERFSDEVHGKQKEKKVFIAIVILLYVCLVSVGRRKKKQCEVAINFVAFMIFMRWISFLSCVYACCFFFVSICASTFGLFLYRQHRFIL